MQNINPPTITNKLHKLYFQWRYRYLVLRQQIGWWLPLLLIICIQIVLRFPRLIERAYSTQIYPILSLVLRSITGCIGFSLGDVGYIFIILFCLFQLYVFVRYLYKKRKVTQRSAKRFLRQLFFFFAWVYIIFELLWGLNYSRQGIAAQLHLRPQRYTTKELTTLTHFLVQKQNETRAQMGNNYVFHTPTTIFNTATACYKQVHTKFPFLNYRVASIKKNLYGSLGNYVGYSGYYNPFTGEAQLNTTGPKFILPFVTCHEMAHQLGYAAEDEANFIAYLVGTTSNNVAFQYAAYFNIFLYANSELYRRDTGAARRNMRSLNPLVRQDLQTYLAYINAYKNPLEPIFNLFYDKYLKANHQQHGINSYNQVVGLLIAYEKK